MTAYGLRKEHEEHSHPTFLSDFILGSQDGLVNVLGVVLGVSAATSDIRILAAASLAALGAETISMGAVAYTSTLSRRRLYLKEVEQEKREMKEVPNIERQEVRTVLKGWGYTGKKLEQLVDDICSNPKAWLEFMMAHELKMSPIDSSQPLRSFIVVLAATLFGSAVPLIPFIFIHGPLLAGAMVSLAISAIVLFLIGYYEARVTKGSILRSGLQMMVIGLAAGIVGYLIGRAFGATS